MMFPPLEWEDLYGLGVAPGATVTSSANGHTVTPQPSRLVRQLLAELTVRPAPEGDRMAYLRHVRDALMRLTDYTQASDSPLSDEQRQAWAEYRQELRGLPQTYSGSGPIPWPAEPA